MNQCISVVLADDHCLVRESLSRWFEDCPDIRIVAHVPNGDEALAACVRLQPSVAVLDIDMPGRDSFDTARAIRSALPQTRVVFLSALVRDCFIEQALAVRAYGYVTKGGPPENLATAIRSAVAGQVYLSPEVRARIAVDADSARLANHVRPWSATVSARELEVLRNIARGLTGKEIAERMGVSADTVHTHTASLMKKLQVHSRVELATFAVREGLLST